jgi:hypothetical protein
LTNNKIEIYFFRDATKEDAQIILRDIKKAYEYRIKLFELVLKKFDAIFEVKDY